MLFNAMSFVIIGGCYIRMYIYIRGSHAWNSKDFRIAKRMAILVVTDFLCWAPIIFFTVSAAVGSPLVGLNEAKVLTIFVLPLNSCANPFLYAIFTKQFKRDCVKLCKRIEESSISRSFSNFNSLRLSFGINVSCRNSELHSPFHEKRGSSRSNSDSFASSVQNQNGEPGNYDVPKSFTISDKVNQNLELKQKGITNKKKTFIQSNNNTNNSPNMECGCQRCRKQSTFSVGPGGTDTEIIIHLDKNGDKLSKSDDVAKYIQPDTDEDVIETYDSENEMPKSDDKLLPSETGIDETCLVCGQILNSHNCQKYCELSKQIKEKETIDNGKVQRLEKVEHTKSAPFVPCRSNDNILRLPQPSATKDKTSHINEWRKSSHLSFLWRNSLDLDTGMPKYKSNSVVELARSPKSFDKSPSKRRSLSSRHEGYLLFKNLKRDSAYENEEEMFAYEENLKDFPAQYSQGKYSQGDSNSKVYSQNDLDNTCEENDEQFEVSDIQNTYDHKDQNDQDLDDVECPEKQTLLLKPHDKNSNPKRDICDKESGFSSDSQLLNC